MLQSLKNKGRTLSLVALLLAATSTSCAPMISNTRIDNDRLKAAIEEQLRDRRNATIYKPGSFGWNSPLGAEKYQTQDRNTIGEQNPDFKGMPLPDEETWEQRANRLKGKDRQLIDDESPWNLPGYQNPRLK